MLLEDWEIAFGCNNSPLAAAAALECTYIRLQYIQSSRYFPIPFSTMMMMMTTMRMVVVMMREGEDAGSNVMISLQPVLVLLSTIERRMPVKEEWACPWSPPTAMRLPWRATKSGGRLWSEWGVMSETTCGQRGSDISEVAALLHRLWFDSRSWNLLSTRRKN